jgi:hypothetical protein
MIEYTYIVNGHDCVSNAFPDTHYERNGFKNLRLKSQSFLSDLRSPKMAVDFLNVVPEYR